MLSLKAKSNSERFSAMEYDPEVLEFYDQPTTFQIHYQSGKKMVGPYYTPDFLVLRCTSATFEEWKTASDLQQLAERVPTRYQQTADSLWHCPPAEAYTDPLGLFFRVRSSAELHPTYVDNLAFLEDYYGVPLAVPESVQTHILQRLRETPGLPLSALSYDGSGLRPHDIYALLAQKLIYTDLYAAPLIKHGRVRLYLSEDQAAAYAHLHPTALVSRIGSPLPDLASDLPTNTLLLWDGRSFTLVNPGENTTTLLPEKGPPLQIPSPFFFHLLEQGEIKRLTSESQAPTTAPEVDQLLDRATPADQRQANDVLRGQVPTCRQKDTCAAIAPRTLHRWVARYQ